jgi:ketosteroid isomerase-like protein
MRGRWQRQTLGRTTSRLTSTSTVIAPGLACTLEIESYRARVGGAGELASVSLRVTTLFRREDGVWKVVHRHADPITATRPPRSVIQE